MLRTLATAAILTISATGLALAQDAPAKPNILVIFGDDIGQSNVSAYSRGMVGYMTPNIDRIAAEGMLFTDYYAENSCTAGRSSFITGQSPKRTGLSKVGVPGAPVGLQDRDITIAQALKGLGYATGQFAEQWPYILGALFVLVTLFMPKGLIGLPEQLRGLARKLSKRSAPPAPTASAPAEPQPETSAKE